MREIKFRAWDKQLKTMSPVKALHFKGRIVSCDNTGKRAGRWAVGLMQYTGLKDKNGGEIYEGDIVIRSGEIASEVFWRRGCYGVRTRMGDTLLTFPESWEVIGNIYENPELLEGSNV